MNILISLIPLLATSLLFATPSLAQDDLFLGEYVYTVKSPIEKIVVTKNSSGKWAMDSIPSVGDFGDWMLLDDQSLKEIFSVGVPLKDVSCLANNKAHPTRGWLLCKVPQKPVAFRLSRNGIGPVTFKSGYFLATAASPIGFGAVELVKVNK